MNKLSSSDLISQRSTRLSSLQDWGRALSPLVICSTLMLYLWLLSPPMYADLTNDFIFIDTDEKSTYSYAWGDMDGDGDLDIAIGNEDDVNRVYRNEGGQSFSLAWETPLSDTKSTRSVAWGDMDGDGDLDLVFGNDQQVNQIYRNDGEANFSLAWESEDAKATSSVAWGDLDGDGDFDLAVGNQNEINQLFENQGAGSFTLLWESTDDIKDTRSVAWADWDSDGDLDLAIGNSNDVNQIYENQGGTFVLEPDNGLGWESTGDTKATRSIAWADMDDDGDLDLAVGNSNDVNQVYQNEAGTLVLDPDNGVGWQTDDTKSTWSVAWGDMDGDGDLDLAVGNWNGPNGGGGQQLYRNEGDSNFSLAWESAGETKYSRSVAWGDVDGDGDLDLGVGNSGEVNLVHLNSGAGGFSLSWQSISDTKFTSSVAWGDMDGDGYLDLAVGNDEQLINQLYRNEDGEGFSIASLSLPTDTRRTTSVAWGDVDGDGDLDLAVGNQGQPNQIYRNEGQSQFSLAWESADAKFTFSVAWGDMDGDGDLDLAVANRSQVNQIYRNDGEQGMNLAWESSDEKRTSSVAWGDMDGDGDLDLVFGNGLSPTEEVNQVYRNEGGGQFNLAWQSTGDQKNTYSVAWGDMDGDGDLDLAVGNYQSANQIYRNEDGNNFSLAWEALPDQIKSTRSVAWGDMDGDGDLDLAVGNSDNEVNEVYQNEGGGNFSLAWQSTGDTKDTWSIGWGDMDRDGDLDLAIGNESWQINQVFENTQRGAGGLPNNPPFLAVTRPDTTANANFYASTEILTQTTIAVPYTLFDAEGDWLGHLEVFYSINGGGSWREAVPTTDTLTTNLASSPNGVNHLFTWDTFASGFFGQSDNVVLRFVAYPQAEASGVSDSHQYANSVPGPFQREAPTASTFPFRVRGTQVQVYSETIASGHEVMGAMVYRLLKGQSIGAKAMGSSDSQPFFTGLGGDLRGGGELALGDKLVAMQPITSSESHTLYQTSAAPTLHGLEMYTVTVPGVQELVVSPDNSLMIFDLDVSLEWDARHNSAFLEQLDLDLKRTSQFLYDWTNGQVALGRIRVYHASENWLDSHILIRASNNLRPNADLGGIVTTPLSETLSTSDVISNAYLPGQIRMSPIWNRFGNIDDELGQDWPRTLAHELGHYLLFLPDNYLGIENGLLTQVECQGSAMTDHYRDDYSEFLRPSEWSGACLNTLAEHTTGHSDWETITKFYPMFDGTQQNAGPRSLPLDVTQVSFVEPETPANTLIDPFFYATDQDGIQLDLPIGQAQAYLFKTRGTAQISDDVVIAIGVPFAEQIQARGAEPGDRLCVFDYSQTPRRLGCLEAITQGSTNLPLYEVPGWQPQITVNPVSSRTLAITITQAIASGDLYAQILPAAHPTSTGVITAPFAAMIPIGSDTFTQTITLDYPIANGFVRVWLSDTSPLREEITEFFLSDGWGPASGGDAWGPASGGDAWGPASGGDAWGPGIHRYGWGVSRSNWQAPVTSRDGQVTIFDLEQILGGSLAVALQSLSTPPNLPPWLTPVGQAYRFSAAEEVTRTLHIMFSYLQREVPRDREDRLWMAYSPDDGSTWQLLPPELDAYHNLASAQMPGSGIYTLISTINVPLSGPYWNIFSYLAATKPVSEALASIDGYYTLVANYEPARPQPWLFYDPAVEPEFATFVNELTHLELEEAYFIHATEGITLYLPGGNLDSNLMESSGLQLPPAPFYGSITPTPSFTPTVGMAVKAWIDGKLCGETTVEDLDGELVYKLQVMAENVSGPPNGCGASGQNIVFQVGKWVMAHDRLWNNSQASYHPLTNTLGDDNGNKIYLPLITRPAPSLSVTQPRSRR